MPRAGGGPHVEVIASPLAASGLGRTSFDSILYIDVLEHIDADAQEVRDAARYLRPGGHLIVLSPAHEVLFSPFDAAIGHYRRYSRAMLARLTPPSMRIARLRYLDAAGMLASLGNRFLLRSGMPTPDQIRAWDRGLVPISRKVDRVLGYRVGKSALIVWEAK